jgi:subtilisin family serine protease
VDAAHPDLAGTLVPGWNFHGNNEDTSDVNGHGTLVAGAAAAAGNNGIGVAGVAMQSRIMPVRVADAGGYAYYSTIASALTWAVDSGARVMNVSFGGVAASSAIRSAARYVGSRGGVVVAAAGNCGCPDPTPENPYIISAGATTSSDVVASWSSRGAHVDVAAPGTAIRTTARGGSYRTVSGTSFASSITAGVIALMMAANPTLSPAELEALLKASADDLGEPGWDPQYGHGRVDAEQAVAGASGGQGTPAPRPDSPAPPGPTTFSVALQLSTPSAMAGQPVRASFTGVNSGAATVVDAYLVILPPPGAGPGLGCPYDDAVVFFAHGAQYVVTCASAPPQTFPALFPSLAWPAGPLASAHDLLNLIWPDGAPTGTYTFLVFLTPAGALSDGVIDASDVLAVGSDRLIAR